MIARDKSGTVLKALLAAWVTMIFGTSALLFFFAPLSLERYNENAVLNFLRSVWEIGDEMGPAVKISLIVVFAILSILVLTMTRSKVFWTYILSISSAMVAVILILAFLPAEYSRGFGIGLSGQRFDPQIVPIYLIGAALGGLMFAIVIHKNRPAR